MFLQTTNGEQSFELKTNSHKRSFIETIGSLECPILTSTYDSELNHCILHVYGYLQEPESVIITDHHEQICNDDNSRSKLRAILENKTLLFVGYRPSMVDRHFPYLLKSIHRVTGDQSLSMYKLIQLHKDKKIQRISGCFIFRRHQGDYIHFLKVQ